MFHFTYKTVNTVNGRYYLGKHSTDNIDDGYLGSGKLINRAIEKHGRDKFQRIILEYFETAEEAFIAESKLISMELVKDDNCYNITLGGDGGFSHINNENKDLYLEKAKITNTNKSQEQRDIENSKKGLARELNPMYGVSRRGSDNPMFGRTHSDIAKSKMSTVKINTFPAKDTETSLSIGTISTDDPLYISGRYTHANAGFKHTKEFRENRSREWKIRKIRPPSSVGLLWWNNGVECKRSKECPGHSWVRGRKINGV